MAEFHCDLPLNARVYRNTGFFPGTHSPGYLPAKGWPQGCPKPSVHWDPPQEDALKDMVWVLCSTAQVGLGSGCIQ